MSRTPDDASAMHTPLASNLRRFYARHPAGALRTSLVRMGRVVVVRAALYRQQGDRWPAATALGAAREADGGEADAESRSDDRPETDDRTLRLAETRAIRTSLGYLGIDEPSIMAGRAGEAPNPVPNLVPNPVPNAVPGGGPRIGDPYEAADGAVRRRGSPAPNDAATTRDPALRDHVADLAALIATARRVGLRGARAGAWLARLDGLTATSPEVAAQLQRAERRLRRWIARGDPV